MFDYNLLLALWAVLQGRKLRGRRPEIEHHALGHLPSDQVIGKPRRSPAGHSRKSVSRNGNRVLSVRSYGKRSNYLNRTSRLISERPALFMKPKVPSCRSPLAETVLNTWFNPVIKEFCQQEDVMVHILRDDREFTIDTLKNGEVIAVVTTSEKAVSGLKSIPLGRLEYSAIVSPELSQEWFSSGVTKDAIGQMRGIAYDEKDSLLSLWTDHIFGERFPLKTHRIPSFLGYIEACAAGIGWGVAPSAAVSDRIQSETLIELHPESPYVYRPSMAIQRRTFFTRHKTDTVGSARSKKVLKKH